MARFRKKPVVIDAIQWDGTLECALQIKSWTDGKVLPNAIPCNEGRSLLWDGTLTAHTLEGPLNVSRQDWIIRGVQGEFYPCKPDIFEQTYEPETP
jgi:hypothetical protein